MQKSFPGSCYLQTGDVGAEEGRELPPAPRALALVAQLVVQHVRLHFHLKANEMVHRERKVLYQPLALTHGQD